MPYIVIEGPDGAGKTTQTQLLLAAMQAAGLPATSSREPGGTEIGNAIRPVLVQNKYDSLSAAQELILFNASRISFIKEIVQPSLKKGDWFVADRYYHSTLAYQTAGGVDETLVAQITALAVENAEPDITIILDVDAATGLTRSTRLRNNEETRMEEKGQTFHEKVVENYRKLATRPNTVLLDARPNTATVHASILQTLNTRFNLTLQSQI